jgi:N-methylhydantoinase A/oxoprolinase/acetone carboxylase beta subunit
MPSTVPALGVGLDTGGTFTDIVLWDLADRRVLRKAKTPTTHGDYAVCIRRAFAALALQPAERAALGRVALSTTLATNAVAEGRIQPAAMVLEPGDIAVPSGLHPQLVTLKSQIGFDAVEVVPVSRDEVLTKVAPLAGQVESFAVSGYASTRDPAHERQIRDILREAFGKPVVLGSQLTHRLNFMERARAAVLNAGLLPVIMEWLAAVKGILQGLAITCPLYIVKGDGSLMTEAEALGQPVHTLFSGPAASLCGGGELVPGPDGGPARQAIVVDVGGTTTDMGRIVEGAGVLRQGGLRINNRSIAVDGLEMATFGLGGDSRLRLVGEQRYRFQSERALPFCRVREAWPKFSLDALEAELEGQWHFGDMDLLELIALDQERPPLPAGSHLPPLQEALLNLLREGPLRLRRLALETGEEHIAREVEVLLRRRQVLRVALTPTDVYAAGGEIDAFSRADAEHALRLYARMLDETPADLRHRLRDTLRRQALSTLAALLLQLDPPPPLDGPLMEHLVTLLDGGENHTPALRLMPGVPVVLVGAGAPMLFRETATALLPPADMPTTPPLVVPEHGDVANAVGAIASHFTLRETVTVEPLRYGRVELFDHEGKQEFDSLADGLAHAHRTVRQRLEERADALGLGEVHLDVREELMEQYADFSARTRKELVIARVHGIVTGMPVRG